MNNGAASPVKVLYVAGLGRSGSTILANTLGQVEGFFSQLAETLDAIDFHKGRAPESAMRKLRRLFLRADLSVNEVRLLRGVLADAQRMARLAAEAGRLSS